MARMAAERADTIDMARMAAERADTV